MALFSHATGQQERFTHTRIEVYQITKDENHPNMGDNAAYE